ncbi:MAG: hypothetical protein QOG31_595 [Thermoplasmata archaeon]|jgi:hypothetical protein|nr:hypothetical protein [Thermoplasmata archaeon]
MLVTKMKGLLAIFLLALLVPTPLVGTARADPALGMDPCPYAQQICEILYHLRDCTGKPAGEIPECLGVTGDFCISFHVGPLTLELPHATRERAQFVGVGAEFVFPPRIESERGTTDVVGFGVFTIDLNSASRTC